MERERDWTPVVLLTATLCVTVVGMVWVTTPWLRGALFEREVGPGQARRLPPSEVPAWAGEVAPGVKGLLAPVWGDPGPDRFHDEGLNARLALGDGRSLAWYRLLLFNFGAEDRTIPLSDGALAIRPGGDLPAVPLRSLPSMLSRGEVEVTPADRLVLEALGALETSVLVPAQSMASLLVAFRERVDLAAADAVATGDGGAFHRRPMARAELQDLLYDPPDEQRVRDL